jgi:hypothetical protein
MVDPKDPTKILLEQKTNPAKLEESNSAHKNKLCTLIMKNLKRNLRK